jgi:hypothetical protein
LGTGANIENCGIREIPAAAKHSRRMYEKIVWPFIFYAPGLKPPALAGKLSAVEKTGKLG